MNQINPHSNAKEFYNFHCEKKQLKSARFISKPTLSEKQSVPKSPLRDYQKYHPVPSTLFGDLCRGLNITLLHSRSNLNGLDEQLFDNVLDDAIANISVLGMKPYLPYRKRIQR
ncbi:hypothetical protein ACTXT7_015373 [Hymenolepis weldensis]